MRKTTLLDKKYFPLTHTNTKISTILLSHMNPSVQSFENIENRIGNLSRGPQGRRREQRPEQGCVQKRPADVKWETVAED